MDDSSNITALLHEWAAGDKLALERLSPVVYDELRRLAHQAFARESGDRTLQPTALVNEVFIKLVDSHVSWEGRAHFFALAARMMRRLLINYARGRNAQKRGAEYTQVALIDDQLASSSGFAHIADALALDEALEALALEDARKVELLELHYFAGLNYREMAAVTGLSTSTLDRELRFAKAWMKHYLTTA